MVAIYKCKECPFFQKMSSWPAKYFCNKFQTPVDHGKAACAEMKGKKA